MIPAAILRRVANREAFLHEAARYREMPEEELLRTTEVFLRNLNRLDSTHGPDGELQLVLVPELWERIRSGTRDRLRRFSSTLAEYRLDPSERSIFAKLLSLEALAKLRADANDLRARIQHAAKVDKAELIDQVRFAIAGSRVCDRWAPDDFVYEPGFVYRLVPALARRVRPFPS